MNTALLAFLLLAAPGMDPTPSVQAEVVTILVAPPGSAAFTHAESSADGSAVRVERRLFRALDQAAEILNAVGEMTVQILVAAGEYPGKTGRGVWEVPVVKNETGRLHIVGGYNDDFTGRQPFGTPTMLVTQPGRPGAFLQFTKGSQLAEVVVSGLLFDAAPSNSYDARSNSILKGQSRTYPMISFAQLRLEHLMVADNVFINGPHGAFDPYVVPAASGALIEIQNNLFLNTIKAMTPAATGGGGERAEIVLRQNSFVLNWPYNPDATSSNVGALELYHSGGASSLTFEGNLFAFNPGGAMQHDWPEDRMPPITLRGNLFYSNGSLFEGSGDEAGVIVGKFGANPTYLSLDLETVQYDLGYTVEGNVSMDPGISLTVAPLQAVNSGDVQRDDTTLNDVRRILGLNQSGGAVPISNYAPKLIYDPSVTAWLPTNPEAQQYGVQPGALWHP